MPETLDRNTLTLQQKALAWGMLRNVGNSATNFVIEPSGIRRHHIPRLSDEDMAQLINKFTVDPKESLALARESLFSIYADNRLSEAERIDRLSRYYDAYVDLNIALDHAAFLPTQEGKVHKGVPAYIADGFVDLGGDSSLDSNYRRREQIVVDKKEIYKKYRDFLLSIFSYDYSGVTLEEKKKNMAARIAYEVYKSLPYDYSDKELGGDRINVSELDEGVCRHQSLVFQVLCQVVGVKSQILKSYMDGGRHVTNAVRVDGEWYIVDVTNPDYVVMDDGRKIWRPGSYKVGSFPGNPGSVHNVKARFSGKEHEYAIHDDMYWYIKPSDK